MTGSKNRLTAKKALYIGIAGGLLLPKLLLADTALEEVVVTAQKRSESVQDIPISVTALSGDAMKTMGMTSAKDLANAVPNMNWIASEGTNVSNIYIRGVGDASFHLNQVGAVGIYIDEVSQNAPAASNFSLFDLERVEVLRGPQNTLFGRNTTGGAIQFVSRKPRLDEDTNGHLNLSYGRLNQLEADGAVGFSLSDSIAARLAISTVSRGDWIDNRTTGDEVGGFERNAGRFQLLWAASDDVDVLFNIHGGAGRGDGVYYKMIGTQDPNDPSAPCPTFSKNPGNGCGDFGGFVDSDDFGENFSGTDPLRLDTDLNGGFVNISWEFPAFTLTSLTAYEESEGIRSEDTDGGPFALFEFHQIGETEQYSQEFRLVSPGEDQLRWIAGLYYFFEDALYTQTVRPIAGPPALPGANPFTVLPGTIVDQENEVWSVYGQIDYDLAENLTLTVGLRYVEETKEAGIDAYVGNGGQYGFGELIGPAQLRLNPLVNLPPVAFEETWREWGGRLALEYRYSSDVLYYGSISRGFKGGGTTVAALEALSGLSGDAVEPEFLLTYEVGAKTSWLDDSLRLNVALFWNQWEDQQLFNLAPSPVGEIPQLVNVPESENYGAEFDLQWVPAEGWFITAGLSLLESEITDAGVLVGVAKGNELLSSPEMTFNGLIRREWSLGDGIFSLQTDFRYVDEMAHNLDNRSQNIEDAFGLINARAAYRFGPEEQYEIALWGKNLNDEEYCVSRSNLTGTVGGIACITNEGLPLYGLSASLKFD